MFQNRSLACKLRLKALTRIVLLWLPKNLAVPWRYQQQQRTLLGTDGGGGAGAKGAAGTAAPQAQNENQSAEDTMLSSAALVGNYWRSREGANWLSGGMHEKFQRGISEDCQKHSRRSFETTT